MKSLSPKIGFAILLLTVAILAGIKTSQAGTADLSGRILLQVESRGEAWYVNPADGKRYFLGRPDDAFSLMRRLGVGISNDNLARIAASTESSAPSSVFVNKNLGKIFLQVESKGEAWYLSPVDKKRYYLGRPIDAFALMRKLGLGISNYDLSKLPFGSLSQPPVSNNKEVIYLAAEAIRANDVTKTTGYFTADMKKAIEYTMNYFDDGGRLALGNLLSSAILKSSSENEKIYSTDAFFSLGGYKVNLDFHAKKQADGRWLLTNL